MPVQLPPPMNFLNLPAIDQARQQSEWNSLRNEALQKQFSDAERIDNTKWLAGVSKHAMDLAQQGGPQAVRAMLPQFQKEFTRRKMGELPGFDSMNDDEFMVGWQDLNERAIVALSGQPGEERYEDVLDAEGNVIAQRSSTTNRYTDLRRGSGGNAPLEEFDQLSEYAAEVDDNGRPTPRALQARVRLGTKARAGSSSTERIATNPDLGGKVADQAASEARAVLLAKLGVEDERAYEESLFTMQSSVNDMDIAISNIDAAMGEVNWWSTGIPGQIMQNLGATDARALKAKLQPVMAALAFDRLQQMRDASKTGGALGQVSERELDLLMNAKFALDQAQEPEAIIAALMSARTHYQNVRRVLKAQQMLQTGEAVFVENQSEALSHPAGTMVVNPRGDIFRVPQK